MTIPRIKSYNIPSPEHFPENKMDWELDPDRAVLLVHDTQEYFINFYDRNKEPIPTMVSNIQKLINTCRDLGVPVAYTAQSADQTPDERGILQTFWGDGLTGKHTEEHIIEELTPADSSEIVAKWRYSAFKSNDFSNYFVNGRDQLVICGVYAHIGCLTTANEAFAHNIESYLIGDAVADFSREDHEMALRYIPKVCGVIKSTEQALKELDDTQKAVDTLSLEDLRNDVADILQIDPEEIYPDDNLMYCGLDSIRLMTLSELWKLTDSSVSFADLAEHSTLEEWAELYKQPEAKELSPSNV